MKVSKPAVIACVIAAAVVAAPSAFGDDLLDVYRSALQNDPTLAAARANWQATQERVPQARSGLLPNVSLSIAPNVNYFGTNLDSDPHTSVNRNFGLGGLTVSASQPLYRYANTVAYSQAVEQVRQADYTLEAAKEDLILRVATSYFNVLLAQFTVELAESQKAAVSEQLAQAKRNFEVGVATITDTNEAQAKYDQIVAQEITARNDLENQRTALRAIIGRNPGELKRLGGGFEPALPSPNNLDKWVDQALADNLSVRIAQYNADIATLEIERQRAGRLPTVDLVASANAQVFNQSVNTNASGEQHQVAIGFAVNVPLYTGGFVDSKVREAYALQDNARQNLEVARRNALFNAQTGFTGVTSAVASVKAFEQALASAQTAYESNKTGLEVGVRTNLDVLNTQQNVYQARHDVAQAYFNYMLSLLRLKSAVGTLSDQDIEEMNRRLRG